MQPVSRNGLRRCARSGARVEECVADCGEVADVKRSAQAAIDAFG